MHTHRVRFGVSCLRAMKPFKDTELGSTAYGGRFTPCSERQRAMLQGSLGALDEGGKDFVALLRTSLYRVTINSPVPLRGGLLIIFGSIGSAHRPVFAGRHDGWVRPRVGSRSG